MTRLAAALLVALALPGSAVASWTPPQYLGTVSVAGPAGGPQFADDGSALAVVSEHRRELEGYAGRVDILRTPAGDWSSRLSEIKERGLDTFRQTVAGDGSVVLLGLTAAPGAPRGQRVDGLGVRFGRLAAGEFSAGGRQKLWSDPYVRGLALAGNRRGEVSAAWASAIGEPGHRGVYVARRRPGHRFGHAARLRQYAPTSGTLAVAVGPEGHTAVAWRKHETVFVRIARKGHPFGKTYRILAPGKPSGIALAAGRGGRVLAAWSGDDGAGMVAERARKGGFRLTTLPGNMPDVAFDSTGRRIVAYATDSGVKVTTFGPGGAQSTEAIAGPSKLLEQLNLATSRRGSVAVMLRTIPYPRQVVYVAVRGAGGVFGPAEQVSPEDRYVSWANLAFDPLSDQPAVVYLTEEPSLMFAAYVTGRQPG